MSDRPILERALRLQRQAAAEGFDWDRAEALLDKLAEELAELRAEVEAPQRDRLRLLDELGDVLFCIVNLARKLEVDAAQALAAANAKFEFRYGHVRAHLHELPPLGDPRRLERMESYWKLAKSLEKSRFRQG